MKEFQLTLRNEKRKQYVVIAFFFALINCVAFFYLSLTAVSIFSRTSLILQAAGIGICILIDYFFKKNPSHENRPALIAAMALAGLAWLKNGNWWAFSLCLIVCFLFAATNRLLIVNLEPGLITYPSFPKRKINWESLNNVILKDGLLTIDQKNNKLIQQYLDESASTINETEFNEFCRNQLNPAKSV